MWEVRDGVVTGGTRGGTVSGPAGGLWVWERSTWRAARSGLASAGGRSDCPTTAGTARACCTCMPDRTIPSTFAVRNRTPAVRPSSLGPNRRCLPAPGRAVTGRSRCRVGQRVLWPPTSCLTRSPPGRRTSPRTAHTRTDPRRGTSVTRSRHTRRTTYPRAVDPSAGRGQWWERPPGPAWGGGSCCVSSSSSGLFVRLGARRSPSGVEGPAGRQPVVRERSPNGL